MKSEQPIPDLLHILFGGQRGGCEYNALQLIRNLPEVRHRVAVLGLEGPACADWRSAGAIVECANKDVRGREAYNAVNVTVARHRPAAALVWHGAVQLPPVIRALNQLQIPAAVHGGNPAHTMPRWVDWKYVLWEYWQPPTGPLPTYICCSRYVADSFETSRYLRRFPRVVVPNGVEAPHGETHAPRELGHDDAPVIGMVARLNAIKDHGALIRAMVHVQRKFPTAVLELAGDGELRSALEHLADELKLSDAVRFLGDVGDVYGRMADWDLFAYATTENEGLGNAVAEAMMFGLPCIVTDVGPTREFAGNCGGVRLVSPGDPHAMAAAICELLPDKPARASLAAKGQRFAQAQFDAQIFAKRYAQVLGLPVNSPNPCGVP